MKYVCPTKKININYGCSCDRFGYIALHEWRANVVVERIDERLEIAAQLFVLVQVAALLARTRRRRRRRRLHVKERIEELDVEQHLQCLILREMNFPIVIYRLTTSVTDGICVSVVCVAISLIVLFDQILEGVNDQLEHGVNQIFDY